MITWIMFLAIGLLAGVGIGIYVSRLDDAAKRQKDTLTAQLDEAEQKMQHYKKEVEDHFISTSKLVNNMTESYYAVHEHLSLGAKNLCDHTINVEKIPFEQKSLEKEMAVESAVQVATSPIPTPTETKEEQADIKEEEALQTTAPESMTEVQQPTTAEESSQCDTETESKATKSEATELPEKQRVSPNDVKSEESAVTKTDLSESGLSETDQSRINASRMVH